MEVPIGHAQKRHTLDFCDAQMCCSTNYWRDDVTDTDPVVPLTMLCTPQREALNSHRVLVWFRGLLITRSKWEEKTPFCLVRVTRRKPERVRIGKKIRRGGAGPWAKFSPPAAEKKEKRFSFPHFLGWGRPITDVEKPKMAQGKGLENVRMMHIIFEEFKIKIESFLNSHI